MNVPNAMNERTLIERLARHLATAREQDWPTQLADAANILALMKEPDAAMRIAGDGEIWRMMIDAALIQRWTCAPSSSMTDASQDGGSDEEGEIALSPDSIDHDEAQWIHLHTTAKDRI